MSEGMSEDERKQIIEFIIKDLKALSYNENLIGIIKETFDLYQKEKEKNKELEKPKYIIDFKTGKITILTNDFISKDKIREIKEALEWKRKQEIEDIGISLLGSAIDILDKLLEEENNEM